MPLSPRQKRLLKVLSARARSYSRPVAMENGPGVRRSSRARRQVVKMGSVPAPKYLTTFINATGAKYPVMFHPGAFVVKSKSPTKHSKGKGKKKATTTKKRAGVKKATTTRKISRPDFYRRQRVSLKPKVTNMEMNNLVAALQAFK